MEMELSKDKYEHVVNEALAEDLGDGDVTSDALISATARGSATIRAKADGILAGTEIARLVFFKVDPDLKVTILLKDGSSLKSGDTIARVTGKLSSILKAERAVLNFLQHLSGIATETSRYVNAVQGLSVKIIDTRKTIPGLRVSAEICC